MKRTSRAWLPVTLALLSGIAFAFDTPPGESDAGEPVDNIRAKQQVERVMNAGLPFAEQMLAERGEFAPYGAVMLPKGLIQTLNPDSALDATSDEIFGILVKGLRRGVSQGEYRALGTFAMVEMKKPEGDGTFSAVHVGLEHQEGYCVDIYYPVVLRGDGLVLGDPMAGKRSGVFFDSCH